MQPFVVFLVRGKQYSHFYRLDLQTLENNADIGFYFPNWKPKNVKKMNYLDFRVLFIVIDWIIWKLNGLTMELFFSPYGGYGSILFLACLRKEGKGTWPWKKINSADKIGLGT